MSSALVREMSSVSGQSAASGRTEIRKKQNRDSARRSREKRKSHLRGVFESVEQQTRRVRELDARVAMLEALVNREVKPRGRPRANVPSVASKPRATIVEEQSVVPPTATPCAQQEMHREMDFTRDLPPPPDVDRPELQADIDRALSTSTPIEQRLSLDDPSRSPVDTLGFPPASPTATLSFSLALDPAQSADQTESLEPTQSINPWQTIPDPSLPDAGLDADCPLEGFIGDL